MIVAAGCVLLVVMLFVVVCCCLLLNGGGLLVAVCCSLGSCCSLADERCRSLLDVFVGYCWLLLVDRGCCWLFVLRLLMFVVRCCSLLCVRC